jgi:hypothetical protein
MNESWEFAVSHTSGEYIIIIGDDDGLLLHSLHTIDHLLHVLDVKALRWERVYYSWPNLPIAESANKLSVPLDWENRIMQARKVIPRIANWQMDYTLLPMLYNSAIHQDLINSLRKKTGRVFGASSPDVYSGFAFAYLAQTYASVGCPMSINGGSAKSNGFGNINLKGNSPVAREFRLLNAKAGIDCHPRIPDIPVMPAVIADSFQRAKEVLFPNDSTLCIDRKRLVINCVQALNPDSELEYRENLQTIRESLADDIGLLKWFDSRFLNCSPFLQNGGKRSEWQRGFDGRNLHLDAAKFGVSDVFGAVELCEKLLCYGINGFEWSEQTKTPRSLNLWGRLRSAAHVLLKG